MTCLFGHAWSLLGSDFRSEFPLRGGADGRTKWDSFEV